MLKKPEKVERKVVNIRLEKEALARLKSHAKEKKSNVAKVIYNIVREYIEKVSSQE